MTDKVLKLSLICGQNELPDFTQALIIMNSKGLILDIQIYRQAQALNVFVRLNFNQKETEGIPAVLEHQFCFPFSLQAEKHNQHEEVSQAI